MDRDHDRRFVKISLGFTVFTFQTVAYLFSNPIAKSGLMSRDEEKAIALPNGRPVRVLTRGLHVLLHRLDQRLTPGRRPVDRRLPEIDHPVPLDRDQGAQLLIGKMTGRQVMHLFEDHHLGEIALKALRR